MKHTKRATMAAVGIVSIIASSGGTAFAADHSADANGAIHAVKQVSAVAPGLRAKKIDGGSTSRSSDPHKAIRLANSAGSFTVGFPDVASGPTSDEHSTFKSSRSYAVVTSTTESDARAEFVLSSAAAPRSYDFKVEGANVVKHNDGTISIASESGEIAHLNTPWAFDAKGRSIPTHYKVSGNTVTQIVSPDSSAAYPIVADPTFGIEGYFVPTMYLNRSETKRAAQGIDESWLCSAAPGAWSLVCGGNAYIIKKGAQWALSEGKCVEYGLGPVLAARPYTGGNCR